jgi:hypothetical protein
METKDEPLPIEPQPLATKDCNKHINDCYTLFCSPQACCVADAADSPKLHNVLVRLHKFSTVIEANRAMRSDDIGRLINVWRIWSFMTQSLNGLTQYSSYLPRFLISFILLPPLLSKLMRHSLLIFPSRRPGHFVPKYYVLETQKYWLKHFYNCRGVGRNVQRLKDLFSLNLPLVSTPHPNFLCPQI